MKELNAIKIEETMHLHAPQGIQGVRGERGYSGKSAYQAAKDGGFVGTEIEFNRALAKIAKYFIDND